jgi:chromosome partitioning protein
MGKIISIFNNKGGVGKTTYMFHVAHMLAQQGRTVLMVDCDAQCNLTAYALEDAKIEKAWDTEGNSIYRAVELVYRGIGDIRTVLPTKIAEKVYLIPGDVNLSNYEDLLGDTWNSAKGGSEPSLRSQSAIYRYVVATANSIKADVVFMDLGPNLGALNRAALGSSDYFIVPVSPDLFSIKGTDNLGQKLVNWRKEWDQCRNSWDGEDLLLPLGRPVFVGYVVQQHNLRKQSEEGMTRGWKIFGDRLEPAIEQNIVKRLEAQKQVKRPKGNKFLLGKIPNLHSLIPYSLEAKKPIFSCTSRDGLTGEHIVKAQDTKKHFTEIVSVIDSLLEASEN